MDGTNGGSIEILIQRKKDSTKEAEVIEYY
jgi:hypothetical protein